MSASSPELHRPRRWCSAALCAALALGAVAPASAWAQYRHGGGGFWHGSWGGYGRVYSGLPLLATVLTIGAVTYWVADGVYYRAAPAGGYVVVPAPADAPPAATTAPQAGDARLFIYPRQSQSAEQQASDEYACHRWAAEQSGFDPVAAGSAGAAAAPSQRADYRRAQAACLDGRGYTVR